MVIINSNQNNIINRDKIKLKKRVLVYNLDKNLDKKEFELNYKRDI